MSSARECSATDCAPDVDWSSAAASESRVEVARFSLLLRAFVRFFCLV